MALTSFLALSGVTHYTTPPHTPQHNGYSERRHRHIVETGLTLMSHSALPKELWPFAFKTAVYLINRMPTPTLQNSSPFLKLFQTPPNYQKLKCFGCLCFPWLKPYTSNKMDAKSTPCVFVGYSLTQSAYYCLDPTTHKVYTSRHVSFVEHIYPFKTPQHHNPTQISQPSDWASLLIPIQAQHSIQNNTTIPPAHHPPSSTSNHSSAIPHIPTPTSSNNVISTEPCHLLTPPSSPAFTNTDPHPSSPSTSTSPPIQPSSPPPQIITRSKNNIFKPITKLNLHIHTKLPHTPTNIT